MFYIVAVTANCIMAEQNSMSIGKNYMKKLFGFIITAIFLMPFCFADKFKKTAIFFNSGKLLAAIAPAKKAAGEYEKKEKILSDAAKNFEIINLGILPLDKPVRRVDILEQTSNPINYKEFVPGEKSMAYWFVAELPEKIKKDTRNTLVFCVFSKQTSMIAGLMNIEFTYLGFPVLTPKQLFENDPIVRKNDKGEIVTGDNQRNYYHMLQGFTIYGADAQKFRQGYKKMDLQTPKDPKTLEFAAIQHKFATRVIAGLVKKFGDRFTLISFIEYKYAQTIAMHELAHWLYRYNPGFKAVGDDYVNDNIISKPDELKLAREALGGNYTSLEGDELNNEIIARLYPSSVIDRDNKILKALNEKLAKVNAKIKQGDTVISRKREKLPYNVRKKLTPKEQDIHILKYFDCPDEFKNALNKVHPRLDYKKRTLKNIDWITKRIEFAKKHRKSLLDALNASGLEPIDFKWE